MGVLRRMHQLKLNRRQRLSGARRVGLVSSYLFKEVARSASGHVRNVQVCNGRWAQTPARLGLDRRAGLSVVPRWGYDVLIFRGRA